MMPNEPTIIQKIEQIDCTEKLAGMTMFQACSDIIQPGQSENE
jgi:hypothetical protein